MFDVIAINTKNYKVRILAKDKDKNDAEAIVKMAIVRRGAEEEIFTTASAGRLKDGDEWI